MFHLRRQQLSDSDSEIRSGGECIHGRADVRSHKNDNDTHGRLLERT